MGERDTKMGKAKRTQYTPEFRQEAVRLCVQCRVLGVSASGYRQHLARRKKIPTRRHLSETALLVEIRAAYAEARGAYGWPRVSTPASKSACRGPRCGGS
jgi:transposase-like protein